MRLAMLEDDPDQAAWLEQVLTRAGHTVHGFSNGQRLLGELRRETYDVLLLDWELPGLTGMDVLRSVRQEQSLTTPVLFLTHRNTEQDIVMALEAGADDYVVKPPRERELIARVAALGRRGQSIAANDVMLVGPYRIDEQARRVTLRDNEVTLTQREFDLALFLFKHLGALVSRSHIMETVWGRSFGATTRTIDTHVSKLRSALALSPENGVRLVPVYGYGYRLESVADAPAERAS
ncbi:MAG: response regulator transcription factor [Steroidobacteraceae bacterium]